VKLSVEDVAGGLGRIGDRRRVLRRLVLLDAWINWPDLWMPLHCQVLDISDMGACLETLRSVVIPHRFELRIPAENVRVRVQQIWRNDGMVGVEFMEALKLSGAATAEAKEWRS